jgi:hypothetical protein
MAKRHVSSAGGGAAGVSAPSASMRELVMIADPGMQLRARDEGVASLSGADTGPLASLLAAAGARAVPLFGTSEEEIALAMAGLDSREDLPDLATFYHVEAPDAALDDLAARLRAVPGIAGAYVKPPALPAAELAEAAAPLYEEERLNDMRPAEIEAPSTTADFTSRQGYLDPAPGGIDARYAWTLPGGRGAGVRICDVEGGWNFQHEDLLQNNGGIVGTPINDIGWENHGTAVAGECLGNVNGFGVTGICPDAHFTGVSIGNIGSAAAIRTAADRLGIGDIVLIELHRGGPRATGQGQFGFIAMEWWPDDYAAIRYAVNKGVLVVEAAGNGSQNLNDAVYDTPQQGFPADWRNPFRRNPRDSGAILVGAGAPPPGTHGRDHGPDRSRLGFSNHGACVDAQGWGREVTSTGYGDLQGGSSRNRWYTDTFSGTSSASPIVVGALACLQGILRARGGRSRIPLDPARARSLLRATGSGQADAPGRPRTERIGNRPNLRQLVSAAISVSDWIGVQFNGVVPANATRTWFTHSWPGHWHVVWNVVPTSPRSAGSGPQVEWRISVQRSSDALNTYFIAVTNLTAEQINIEARYAVLGW